MRRLHLLLIVAIACGACKDESTSPRPSDPHARWRSFNIHNYSVVQTRGCFCPRGGEPMRITVNADTVVSVVSLWDGTQLSPVEASAYYCIDTLFAAVEHFAGDSIVVRYDPTFGYPAHVDIEPQLHPVDGGVVYETTGLRIR